VLDGLGLRYCLDDMAAEAIADGRLIRVLEDRCEPFHEGDINAATEAIERAGFMRFIWMPRTR
jgi:hypothetical protein